MAKTKIKGTAKTVGDTPVPQPITISSTNPKIMADNIKKLEKAIKGADDASEISYDNTTSHLTASNVQAAIDEIAPALDASGVAYDNSDSSLTSDDVQSAIDELTSDFKGKIKIVSGNMPATASSLTVGQSIDELITTTDDLSGYAFVGLICSLYNHLTNISNFFTAYAVVPEESSSYVMAQVLNKTFSPTYNSADIYGVFIKII